MGRDLATAAGLFLLAGLLFLLPADLLQESRLKLYSLWSRSEQAARELRQTPEEFTAETPLREQAQELSRQLILKDNELNALRRELRNVADFRTNFPLTRIIPAEVLGFSGSRDAPEVFLSAGSEDGVKQDYLLAQGSAFVGIVAGVDKNAGVAMLATHPGCVVAGRGVGSRDLCTVRGAGGGRVIAIFYVAQTTAAPGEKLVTSGMTGKAPEGLLIGELLDHPRRSHEQGALEATVKLAANLNQLQDLILLGAEEKQTPQRSGFTPVGNGTRPPLQPGTPLPGAPAQPATPAQPGAVPVTPPATPSTPAKPAEGELPPALG